MAIFRENTASGQEHAAQPEPGVPTGKKLSDDLPLWPGCEAIVERQEAGCAPFIGWTAERLERVTFCFRFGMGRVLGHF
jgi:hypothetical protein